MHIGKDIITTAVADGEGGAEGHTDTPTRCCRGRFVASRMSNSSASVLRPTPGGTVSRADQRDWEILECIARATQIRRLRASSTSPTDGENQISPSYASWRERRTQAGFTR